MLFNINCHVSLSVCSHGSSHGLMLKTVRLRGKLQICCKLTPKWEETGLWSYLTSVLQKQIKAQHWLSTLAILSLRCYFSKLLLLPNILIIFISLTCTEGKLQGSFISCQGKKKKKKELSFARVPVEEILHNFYLYLWSCNGKNTSVRNSDSWL